MICDFPENLHSTKLINQKSLIFSKYSMGSNLHLLFIRVQITLHFCTYQCFLNHSSNTELTLSSRKSLGFTVSQAKIKMAYHVSYGTSDLLLRFLELQISQI